MKPLATLPLCGGRSTTTLSFQATTKCNLRCRHCGVKSSPERTEVLDFDIAAKLIKEARLLGFRAIGITGGEPLLFRAGIKGLLRQGREQGLHTNVVTNGTWATSLKRAREEVADLAAAGLQHMSISYDIFHAEAGATMGQVGNAVTACRSLGVGVSVVETLSKRAARIRYPYRYRHIEAVCDLPRPLNPSGRALACFPDTSYVYTRTKLEDYFWCASLGVMVCMANGTLLPCCAGAFDYLKAPFSGRLTLGNLYRQSVRDCLEASNRNLYLVVLGSAGPRGFVALDRTRQVPWPQELRTICDFCGFAVTNQEFSEWFEEQCHDADNVLGELAEYARVASTWGILPRGCSIPAAWSSRRH